MKITDTRRALKSLLAGKVSQFVTDAEGREHGEAGSGVGGQFVPKGSGGGGGALGNVQPKEDPRAAGLSAGQRKLYDKSGPAGKKALLDSLEKSGALKPPSAAPVKSPVSSSSAPVKSAYTAKPTAEQEYAGLKKYAQPGGWTGSDKEFGRYVAAVKEIREGNIAKTLTEASGHSVTVQQLPVEVYGSGKGEKGTPYIGSAKEPVPPYNWLSRAEVMDKTGEVTNRFGRGGQRNFIGSAQQKVELDQKHLVITNDKGQVLDPWSHHAVYRAAQYGYDQDGLKGLVEMVRTQKPMGVEKRSDQQWPNHLYVTKSDPTHVISVVVDPSKNGKIASIFVENLTAEKYGTTAENAAESRAALKSDLKVQKWKEFENG